MTSVEEVMREQVDKLEKEIKECQKSYKEIISERRAKKKASRDWKERFPNSHPDIASMLEEEMKDIERRFLKNQEEYKEKRADFKKARETLQRWVRPTTKPRVNKIKRSSKKIILKQEDEPKTEKPKVFMT